MKKSYDANSQSSKLYQKWNNTTATCFHYKMNCKICSNIEACKLSDDDNKYRIKQVKFSTLMTYANIGIKGLSRYLNCNEIDIKEEEQ